MLIEEIADHWQVNRKSVQRWIEKYGREVVEDERMLAKQLLQTEKVPENILERCRAVLGVEDEPDLEPVESIGVSAAKAVGDLSRRAAELEKLIDAAHRRMEAAIRSRDVTREKEGRKAYRELLSSWGNIKRLQVLAGQDANEMIPKSEVLRIVYTWASRSAIGIQRIRDNLCPKLVGLTDENQVSDVLVDAGLTEMFLAPFARAVGLAAECNLPPWFHDGIRDAVAGLVANGAEELKKEETNGIQG